MAEQPADADVAQLVERNLAKVEVAGSNLVIRSNLAVLEKSGTAFFLLRRDRATILPIGIDQEKTNALPFRIPYELSLHG